MRVSLVGSLLGALALTACPSKPAPGPTGSPTPSPLISTTGDLTIVSPAPGAVFAPRSVPVQLSLTGAEILEEATTTVRADEGHVHVTLDDQILSLLSGLEFDLVDVTGGPLSTGLHTLRVDFVAGNHVPFSPVETELVLFTVRR
jgi:hypothetical protein